MTLKLESGKFYRTRDGRKIGPMRRANDYGEGSMWAFRAPENPGSRCVPAWSASGRMRPPPADDADDLIAEWRDEPPGLPHGHVELPSGEVVDLTAIEKPIGLLADDVQAALRAHGGPWEMFSGGWMDAGDYAFNVAMTYRVKPAPPAPVRETVKRSLHGEKFMGYVAIDLVDGEHDWSSMRKWEDEART